LTTLLKKAAKLVSENRAKIYQDCTFSPQLIANLEKRWAKEKKLHFTHPDRMK
jgi:hypothetical protein